MRIDKTVKKETGYVIIGQIIFCAILLSIYLIIKKLTWEVSVGAIVGSLLTVFNFFFIGITVKRTLEASEEDQAKIMRASQTTRFLVIALIILLCLAIPKLDPIATLIPLFFPRITIAIRSSIIKRSK